MSARVMLVYNTMKYLHRMRSDLIDDLQARGHQVIAVAPFDGSERFLVDRGVVCIDWRLVGHSVNPLAELMALLRLRRIVRDQRPSHLFGFTIKPVIYGSLVARWHGGIKTFSMIAGLGVLFAGNSVGQRLVQAGASRLYGLALGTNRTVFVQNDEHANYMRESGYIDPDRVVQIPGSGVDLDAYHSSVEIDRSFGGPSLTPQNTQVVFLMASRLLRHKGVEEYIRACANLIDADPDLAQRARFVLAGAFVTGPSAINSEQLHEWLAASPVEYIGEVDDMASQMRASDVLVLPSFYPEGTPRVILEALACGLAVVTTDTPGCRDTVVIDPVSRHVENESTTHPSAALHQGQADDLAGNGQNQSALDASIKQGDNGYLVPTQNVRALARSMSWLVNDGPMRQAMGIASRQLAEHRYSVKHVNRVIIENMSL